ALPRAQDVEVRAAGALVHRSDVGGQYGVLRFTAWPDADGVLALSLTAPRAGSPDALRVSWVRVERSGAAPWPWARTSLFAAALALLALAAAWRGGGARAGAGGPAGPARAGG